METNKNTPSENINNGLSWLEELKTEVTVWKLIDDFDKLIVGENLSETDKNELLNLLTTLIDGLSNSQEILKDINTYIKTTNLKITLDDAKKYLNDLIMIKNKKWRLDRIILHMYARIFLENEM